MPDFGFVGPSYEAPSIYQNAQECINFYPEVDPTKPPGTRGIVALYPTPGYTMAAQLSVGKVRGMRALSGGQYLVVVSGNSAYALNTAMTPTLIGSMPGSGQVSISDNVTTANGLTAYIVNGTDRYTWVASTGVFTQLPPTDGPWTGANVCEVVDNYNIYNQPGTQNWGATDLGSSLSTNAYYGAKDGAPDTLVSLIVDHRQVYLLGEFTTEVWTDIGNVIPGIISFPFQRVPGTMVQHGIAAQFSVARFAEAFMFVSQDQRGQSIIGMIAGYQFQRVSTHAVEQSLVDKTISDAIAWTYQIEGHEFYVVTFPSADLTWVYDLASQAWHKWLSFSGGEFHRHRSNCGTNFAGKIIIGDYQNGMLYQLSNTVYTDADQPIRRLRRAPHLTTDLQRQYFDEFQIQFQPGVGLAGNDPLTALENLLAESYITPLLTTEASIDITTEAGVDLLATLLGATDDLLTESGDDILVTITTTQGVDPQAMLRWSNDGGSTWSSEHWASIGKVGRYQNRAIWRRLGMARDRIFEVSITDPVKAVIVSANLKASVGDN
jgi:hypothetical protein